jgi:hypothetical protein
MWCSNKLFLDKLAHASNKSQLKVLKLKCLGVTHYTPLPLKGFVPFGEKLFYLNIVLLRVLIAIGFTSFSLASLSTAIVWG